MKLLVASLLLAMGGASAFVQMPVRRVAGSTGLSMMSTEESGTADRRSFVAKVRMFPCLL